MVLTDDYVAPLRLMMRRLSLCDAKMQTSRSMGMLCDLSVDQGRPVGDVEIFEESNKRMIRIEDEKKRLLGVGSSFEVGCNMEVGRGRKGDAAFLSVSFVPFGPQRWKASNCFGLTFCQQQASSCQDGRPLSGEGQHRPSHIIPHHAYLKIPNHLSSLL
jgi:hypothetical protein